MDFSLQSEDNKSVYSVSPTSATNSYFTEQALRVGLMGGEIKRVDFAIQRQIEKERIRQEIIAAEIIRRRELEMEVRRELAMEREMALRRGDHGACSRGLSSVMWPQENARFPALLSRNRDDIASNERTAIPSGNTEVGSLDRLPFQRPEAAKVGNNDRGPARQVMFMVRIYLPVVIVLVECGLFLSVLIGFSAVLVEDCSFYQIEMAKPTTGDFIGTKRKLAAVGASELNPIIAKKKAAKDWNCALCKVSATSEQGLKEHLEGRKHRAREAELGAKKITEKHPKEPMSLENKPERPNKKPAKKLEANVKLGKKKQKVPEKKKKYRYWCEDCSVGTHSQKVMAGHQMGKKHMGRVQAQKRSGGSVSSTSVLADNKPEKVDDLEERNEEAAGNVDGADKIDEAEEKGEVDDTEEAEVKREIGDVEEAEEAYEEEAVQDTVEAEDKEVVEDTEEAEEAYEEEAVEDTEEAEDKEVVADTKEAEEKGVADGFEGEKEELDGMEVPEEKHEMDDFEEAEEKKLEGSSKELEPSTVTVIANELMNVSASGTTSNEDSN
ncbi:hypothetical protein Syun_025207 [Stephania yunnanensis]|uniref:U1-type domain-containing protein n=1 Tax=Stephania yunnanensis TaxID=152371 RepID=A0AAP0EWK6_9MAGN